MVGGRGRRSCSVGTTSINDLMTDAAIQQRVTRDVWLVCAPASSTQRAHALELTIATRQQQGGHAGGWQCVRDICAGVEQMSRAARLRLRGFARVRVPAGDTDVSSPAVTCDGRGQPSTM